MGGPNIPVLVLVDGGIGELVLNRPQRKNALSPSLVVALTTGLRELITNPEVTVILIRGNGPEPTAEKPTSRWLCSGVDLKEQARVRRQTGTDGGQAKSWAEFHAAMYSCPKPTVGVLEGGAIAGGTGLALACDFLIAGQKARFHVAEVNFGMAAPYNSIWAQLKHGSHLALELVVGGQRYSGVEIAAKGIALMAVDDTRVLESARAYCAKLARNNGTAMHVVKEMIRRVRGGPAEDFTQIVSDAMSATEVGGRGPGFPSIAESKNLRNESASKL